LLFLPLFTPWNNHFNSLLYHKVSLLWSKGEMGVKEKGQSYKRTVPFLLLLYN